MVLRGMEEEPEDAATRRTVLKAAGATTALAGLAGVGSRADAQPTVIRLGARKSGWVGLAPDDIENEINPTLSLEVGKRYRVQLVN